MKKLHFLLIMIASFSGFGQMSVMSYNIRYDNPADSLNAWTYRKADVAAFLKHYHPAVIGLQEALTQQVNYLDTNLERYTYVGVGRDDGAEQGEFSPIFFDSSRLLLVNSETFWLSETPEQPSIGWDAALPRICTWAIFEDREVGKRFLVMNTHFDHIGEKARLESAKLILNQIKILSGDTDLPVVLMGDLNATPDSKAISSVTAELTDSFELLDHQGPGGTFNGFGFPVQDAPRIDYIFIRDLKAVEHAHLVPFTSNYRQLSDHWPVFVFIK